MAQVEGKALKEKDNSVLTIEEILLTHGGKLRRSDKREWKKHLIKRLLEWGVQEKLRLFILMSSIISFNQGRNYLLRIKVARLRDNFKDSKKKYLLQ